MRLSGEGFPRYPLDFRPTESGDRLIYLRRENVDAVQLWSATVAGEERVRLNGTLRRGPRGSVHEVALHPSGRLAYYVTSLATPAWKAEVFHLWRVELDEPRKAQHLAEFTLDAWEQPFTPWPVQFSADGRFLLHGLQDQSDGTVWMRRADTGEVVRAFHALAPPLLTPDGRHCVVRQANQLARLTLDEGGSLRRIGPEAVVDPAPALLVDPSGERVVFLQRAGAVRELWSALVHGGAPPVRLNGPMGVGGSVGGTGLPSLQPTFQLSDSRAVYVADEETNSVNELYSAPLDGSSARIKISAPMVAHGGISMDPNLGPPFRLSPDGRHAVYVAEQDVDQVVELYRADVLGGPVVRLSGVLVTNGDIGGGRRNSSRQHQVFEISSDGRYVVYLADAETDGVEELFIVPLDASSPARKVNARLAPGEFVVDFGLAPDGAVVYRVDDQGTGGGGLELFARTVDGAPARRIGSELDWIGGYGSIESPQGFTFSPDASQVLFHARPGGRPGPGIFLAPLDGSSPASELSGPMVVGGGAVARDRLPRTLFTRDGARVLYIADQESDEVHELFATFLEHTPRRGPTPDGE